MAASTSHQPVSILLVGSTKTGKTHYGAQLLKRLNDGDGTLVMDGVAENITLFEEALACLSNGRSAGHTPSGVYHESVWPVRFKGGTGSGRAQVVWPDYAGEQVEHITEHRQVTRQWKERIRQANGWLLFIRLEHVH